MRVVYEDGRGVLRRVLTTCTERGFRVADVSVARHAAGGAGDVNELLQ